MANALAMVGYSVFRRSEANRERYGKANYYVSRRRRVVDLVGEGGTLWVVTSRLLRGSERTRHSEGRRRRYSLAYRLRDCRPFVPRTDEQRSFGSYGVIADTTDDDYFRFNDVNDVGEQLLSLQFDPPRPIRSAVVIGQSLQTPRRLAPDDVATLRTLADRIEHGAQVFLSYARKDSSLADRVHDELRSHSIRVFRDTESIPAGVRWDDEIRDAIDRSTAMVVVLTEVASRRTEVLAELEMGLDRYGHPGGLERVVPLVVDEAGYESVCERLVRFDDIARLQRIGWDGTDPGPIRRLAEELRSLDHPERT